MDTQHSDQAPDLDDLGRKADELISLMFSRCEERINRTSAMPDAHASSLAHAAIAAQHAIHTFLVLARIR